MTSEDTEVAFSGPIVTQMAEFECESVQTRNNRLSRDKTSGDANEVESDF